jgi:hypothetical protein
MLGWLSHSHLTPERPLNSIPVHQVPAGCLSFGTSTSVCPKRVPLTPSPGPSLSHLWNDTAIYPLAPCLSGRQELIGHLPPPHSHLPEEASFVLSPSVHPCCHHPPFTSQHVHPALLQEPSHWRLSGVSSSSWRMDCGRSMCSPKMGINQGEMPPVLPKNHLFLPYLCTETYSSHWQ